MGRIAAKPAVVRTQTENEKLWAEVEQKHGGLITVFARQLMDMYPQMEREEAYGFSREEIWRAWATFDAAKGCTFGTWAWTYVKNAAYGYYGLMNAKPNSCRRPRLIGAIGVPLEYSPPSDDNPADHASRSEEAERLRAAINILKKNYPREMECIELYYFGNFRASHIAKIMGMTERQAAGLVVAGRHYLGTYLRTGQTAATGAHITEVEEREMVEEYQQGLSLTEIAQRHGCGHATVSTVLDRCGARRKALSTRYRRR